MAGLIDQNKVVAGGERNEAERYVALALLYLYTWEDKIMMEDEISGPILPILTYSDLDDAITSIKNPRKPLAAYVFSTDNTNTDKLLNSLSFG